MKTKKGCSRDSERTDFRFKPLYPHFALLLSLDIYTVNLTCSGPEWYALLPKAHDGKQPPQTAPRCMFLLPKRIPTLGWHLLTSELQSPHGYGPTWSHLWNHVDRGGKPFSKWEDKRWAIAKQTSTYSSKLEKRKAFKADLVYHIKTREKVISAVNLRHIYWRKYFQS